MSNGHQQDARWWLLPAGALAAGLLLTVPFWLGDLDLHVAQAIEGRTAGGGWCPTTCR